MTPEEYKKETIQMALDSLDEMELAIKSLRKGIAKGTPYMLHGCSVLRRIF